MARLFALADLHLSLSGEKPMDVFGPQWTDHAERMAGAWDARVDADDTVLLPGDLSWALRLDRAAEDLAWIGARPGTKILLRGNHDHWWTSLAKLRRALPAGCVPLQNNALRAGGALILGARGWLAPDDPLAGPDDARIFRRELGRLDLSIADADRLDPRRELFRVAALHYPPWIEGRAPTAVVERLQTAGVRLCVYGHLHGEDHALGVTGVRDGIDYRLVAADAVGFAPVELPLG